MKNSAFLSTLSKVMGIEVRPVSRVAVMDPIEEEAAAISEEIAIELPVAEVAKPKKKEEPPVVNIRSFYASSIEEAMRKAEAALGPDAVILRTKTTDPEFRAEGAFEVVCGLTLVPRLPKARMERDEKPAKKKSRRSPLSILPDPEEEMEQAPAPVEHWAEKMRREAEEMKAAREAAKQAEAEKKSAAMPLPEFVLDDTPEPEPESVAAEAPASIHHEISELRRLIEALQVKLGGPAETAAAVPAKIRRHGLATMRGALIDAGLTESRAREITEAALRASSEAESNRITWPELRQELARRIPHVPEGPAAKAVLFIGGPGSRKTEALFAMANQKKAAGETVRILAPASAAATFEQAAFDGLDSEAYRTSSGLLAAISKYSAEGVVLVDTPEFGPADTGRAAQFSRVFEAVAGLETHLVLNLGVAGEEMAAEVDRLAIFNPKRLLFTGEVAQGGTFGVAFEQVLRTSWPASRLSGEELTPFTSSELLQCLLEDNASADNENSTEVTVK